MTVTGNDKSELKDLFPLPCTLVETRGIGNGIILKFKTFYLKIYDDPKEDSYIVKGFRYTESNPVFEDNIRTNRFREYASQFKREDFLGWKIK